MDGKYYAHKLTMTLSLRKITVPKIIDGENILSKDILFMSISTNRNSYAPIGLPRITYFLNAEKILGSYCLEPRKHPETKIIVAENFLRANTL